MIANWKGTDIQRIELFSWDLTSNSHDKDPRNIF